MRGRGLLLVLAVAAALVPAAAVPPAPAVLVLGDSYASGEGLASAEGVCGTETERSWGALVAAGLGASDLQLLACSGAEVADVTTGGPLGRPAQLAVAEPADLVLLTVGGNDLGFTEIVADCLGFAELRQTPTAAALDGGGWLDLVEAGEVDRGCDVTQQELLERVAGFAQPDRFPLASGGTGSLADLHAEVARAAVADGGQLVVVGYPALFAEVARWPERYGGRCHGLRDTDAQALARVVVALDQQLAAAVADANQQLGAEIVRHVSVLGGFDGTRDGEDHRLCGAGEPWMNGLTVVEGGIDVTRLLAQLGAGPGGLDLDQLGARPGGSFHPSSAGHRGIAAVVLEELAG